MSSASRQRAEPPVAFLLEGSRGLLHAVYFPPQGVPHPQGDILFVPPFAEEMNRCRAMVALQARQLATVGIGTLVCDPFGTGDSAGDFVDARWAQWQNDLLRALHWLRLHGRGCRTLWGLRLGGAMASQLAVRDGDIDRLLLWQPVLDGKQFYTQFLRIRIAAELNLPDRVKSTGELRQRSAAGEPIEVSGYRIGPALAAELDAVKFDPQALAPPLCTDWFEVLAAPDAETPPATLAAMERWRADGADTTLHSVQGPAFWQVHERELAPALIAATTQRLQSWTSRSAAPREPAAPPVAIDGPELPMFLPCGSEHLSAVLHRAPAGASRGVVIVVAGGPQYRVGAHRQFVTLARRLVGMGLPVLRFDLRGMGDSSGEHLGYRQSEPDIAAAIDALVRACPQVREIVLLGECESASGILFYAWRDSRVSETVLINPWVRTDEGRAQVIVRHYYLSRLFQADFWRQVVTGRFKARESLASLMGVLRDYARGRTQMARQRANPELDDISGLPLPVRVAEGLRRFKGRSLLLMSGFDFIAREFDEVTRASKAWEGLLQSTRLQRVDIAEADHTFSREVWKSAAAEAVAKWLQRP